MTEPALPTWPGQVVMVLPYLGVGGTEYHVLHLLQSVRWERPPLVLAPDGPLRRELEAAGARVVLFVDPTRRWLQGWRSLKAAVGQLGLHIEAGDGRYGPAVVHVHGAAELLWLVRRWLGRRLRPRPAFIFTSHGYFGPGARWSYPIAARILRRTRTPVIAVSRQEAQRLVGAGLPPGQVQVIPNGIPDPLREPPVPWPFGPGSPRILSVGRLVEQKGMHDLLEAFEQVVPAFPSARLVIVGAGPLYSSLRRRVEQSPALRGRVELPGAVERAWRLLRYADVFCLASRDEAMPLTLLEAMGSCCALVTTCAGGNPEVVEDGQTGLLVPPGDVAALAAALRRLLGDETLRRRLGQAARRRFEAHFTAEAMARQTVAAYQQAVGLMNHLARTGSRDRAPSNPPARLEAWP